MDEAGERLVAECDKLYHNMDKANSKKSKHKKTVLQLHEKLRRALKQVVGPQADQKKLCRALKQVSWLQDELGEAQGSLSARSAECDQLRRILSDRDVTLDQMRVQLADAAFERDRAIRDHTTLRDRMALLVSGDTSATPTKVGSSTHTPVPAPPQPMSNGLGLCRKRFCDPLPSSTLPPFWKVTRPAASKVKPSLLCVSKVARSAAAKAKPSRVRDPKPPSAPPSAPKGVCDPKGRRDLMNRHDPAKPAATSKLGKQRRRGPGLTLSKGEDTSAGEDNTLAALSGSRSSSRLRASTPAAQTSAGPSPDPIVIDTPSSSRDPPPPVDTVIPTVTKLSRADLFGEASSDSDGAISLFDSLNPMLSQAGYDSLPPTNVSRDQWIPGYRDRVPRSFAQVSPWLARKVSWTSVAEMDTDFLYRHLSCPKGYVFPTVMVAKCPPSTSEWTFRLACSAQIAALHVQKPWETATRWIAPISFPRTGWFDQLASLYLEFEDRNR
uniref:Uncharacterized protein n=1 Tax=Peronospora matthiolae TaxID=2874970 RepID=A0AAV1U6X4_9STRA